MPENSESPLEENAHSPKSVTGDAGSVEQHSLKDQIELDRYRASKAASKSKGRGIRISRMMPPGAV